MEAGWKTDKATIVARAGARVDVALLDRALQGTGFRVLRLERVGMP